MKYKYYEVFETPEKPTEYGKVIGHTPIFDQAKNACEIARRQGKSYGIKGVIDDERKVVMI